jgi:hypothetical protein
VAVPVTVATDKPRRQRQAAEKINPKLVAAARELRDVYLERVNGDPSLLVSQGKYEVRRLGTAEAPTPGPLPRQLPAAA